MAYASASDVAAFCQNLLSPEYTFTVSTSPAIREVNAWLSSGCSIIEARLAAHGYAVPLTRDLTIYEWIRELNAYYATAMAETSRTNVITGPGERTRGMMFEKMFWDGLNKVTEMDLTYLGVAKSSEVGTMYVGGISYANKQTNEGDSDLIPSRFRRNQFGFDGTVRPDNYTRTSDGEAE